MTIRLIGPLAKEIQKEAAGQLRGNAWRYASGDADWWLRDLAGAAKKWSSTYRNARATAAAKIEKAARTRRYELREGVIQSQASQSERLTYVYLTAKKTGIRMNGFGWKSSTLIFPSASTGLLRRSVEKR